MEKKIHLEITDQELSRLEETVNVMIFKLQKDWCESEDVLQYKSLLAKLQSAFSRGEVVS
ncbi:hypothetical protein ACFS7Z_15060 [Pontibacter toksunensis]|uniref:Uncharacterized protein n=1 Tax=Pontibacter toksunensis TaxID=1332631 RepID=A0ABW6BWI4_9BACT